MPSVEVATIVPEHGGGALYVGGVPGNAGGPGRPPSAIRLTCRESFAARVKILEDIADGEPIVKIMGPDGRTELGKISASPSDRIKAIDTLGKYGGIEKLTVETPPLGSLAQMGDDELLEVLQLRTGRLEAALMRRRDLRDPGPAPAVNDE